MGALQINDTVKISILLLLSGTIIIFAFSFDSAVPTLTEQPTTLEEKAQAIDATNEKKKVLEEWSIIFEQYRQALIIWEAGINSWETLAKDDYGKIGSASVFPQAYADLHQKTDNALTFVKQNKERFIAAEVNPQALEDQLQNTQTQSRELLNQALFDLLLIERTSQQELSQKISQGAPTNVVENKIHQLNKVVEQLRAAQEQYH